MCRWYHQKFTNNPHRSASGVWFVETFFNTALTPPAIAQRPTLLNFVAAVPVEVNGAEAEVDFSATPNWDIGAVAAYSKGEIKNGFAPCNDFTCLTLTAPREFGLKLRYNFGSN